jgi:hypothetical protein
MDSDGGVVGSGAGHLAHAQDVLHTEADACLKAISQAQAWGMQNIHVETYSQLLVQALSNDQDLELNSVVFKDIKFQVRLNFPFFSVFRIALGHVTRLRTLWRCMVRSLVTDLQMSGWTVLLTLFVTW